MADKSVKPAGGGKKDDAQAEPKKGGGPSAKSKRVVLIVVAVIALVAGIGGTVGVLHLLGLLGTTEKSGRQVAVVSLGAPVLVDMPEVMVDLKVGSCRSPYLRYAMRIEVTSGSAAKAVDEAQARIMDAVQQHLRGKERQDLVGVEGADRMRNDARDIINRLIAPERINGVLFKKFVLQ